MFLLKFHEQIIDQFLIPAFTLAKGEIVVIQLPNLPCSYHIEMILVALFTGKTINDKAEVMLPLTWGKSLKESRFRHYFLPTTVGAYLNKQANASNSISEKIYEIEWMTPKIRINTLAGNPRKRLALYKTLSWTNNIVFDLAGVDPQGSLDIYSLIKTIVQPAGAAILFDWRNDFKDDCTTFIQVKYLGDELINVN